MIEIDPLGFDEWVSDLDKAELLHAYKAIKLMELLNFQLVAMKDDDLVNNVRKAVEEWARFK